MELDRIEPPGQVEGMLAGLNTMLSAEGKTYLMRLPTYRALAALRKQVQRWRKAQLA